MWGMTAERRVRRGTSKAGKCPLKYSTSNRKGDHHV
ncbi:hypothetical protein DSM3645_02798 [Blastopirellula marina DSM 3645]|uniref:Uncharacterized protein n=1 Tax=Blastopirellula marina DSM 3645 TaxID=314230 RepID=A3ZVM3_9BACT|nr:hypothetical protein DSM3645_02798 [Blastopirellula marina DSM 3645]